MTIWIQQHPGLTVFAVQLCGVALAGLVIWRIERR